MANPAADYPTSIHNNTDISAYSSSKLGSTAKTHTQVEGKQEEEIKEIQTKIGLGASPASSASTNQVLRKNADGSTYWETVSHTQISDIGSNTHAQIDTHIANTSNPHSVTANQILPSQASNSGKYLTTDGTDSSWAAVAGGSGQTLYGAIVAASGGDYTTLGAAITGGATSIFVRNGTYTEVADITVPIDTIIVGESELAIVDLVGYQLDMQAGDNTVDSVHFKSNRDGTTIPAIRVGNRTVIKNCVLEWTHVSIGTDATYIGEYSTAKTDVRLLNNKLIYSVNDTNQRYGIYQQTSTSAGWNIDGFFGKGGGSLVGILRVNGTKNTISNINSDVSLARDDAFYISGSNNSIVNVSNMDATDTNENVYSACTFGSLTVTAGSSEPSKFSGCVFTSSVALSVRAYFSGCHFSNTLTVNSGADDSFFSGCYFDSSVTHNSGADGITYSGCHFDVHAPISGNVVRISACHIIGNLTLSGTMGMVTATSVNGSCSISGNDNTIVGSRIGEEAGSGSNTITITAAANRTIIGSTRTDAAISDSGTSSSLANNVVY